MNRCLGFKTQRGRRDRGVALITALLVTSLASIMAISLVASQQIEIRRTGNLINSDRAYVFALGVESWVKQILVRDDSKKDSLDEDWAMVLPPITVEGGQVAGRIEDMQSRFNLNNVINGGKPSAPDVQIFERLLDGIGQSPDLVQALLDWIDADIDTRFEGAGGAEDDEYTGYDLPYRAANQPLASPSELLLVKGFSQEIYDQLAPLVTALPVRTPINVNTAPAPVLAALSEKFSRSDAEALIELREESSFANVGDFLQQDMVKDRDINQDTISIKSDYFMLDGAAQYGERGKVRLFSLLSRSNNKVGVIMRAQGVY